MKKLMVFLLMGCLGSLAWAGEQKKDVAERLQMATDVLSQMASAPDKGIPEEVLDSAKCIAVVPHLVKGGFIFGGKHGRGVATCRTASGWSAPAFISVGGGSAGLQIGIEGVDLIMLIMNDKGMQQLLTSKFQISGEGSAAAGPVGRHASAGTDWKLDTEMLTYSRSKGVFAGLTLEASDEMLAPIPPDRELLLSHRQVDDYQTCPLKYRYIHLLRVPILRHHTVVYGNTVHKVVEYYLKRRVAGNYTSLEDLLAIYEREWDNQGFLTWDHEEARKAAGRSALTRFWHEEEVGGVRPSHVEKDFGFSLGADRVRGRFDRVDEDLLGATIIDYKTGEVLKQAIADRRTAESLQLQMYALAWREMTGALPQWVELRFIESNLVGRHAPDEDDVEEATEAITAAAAGIRARRFEATPSYSACRYCAYSQICPFTATRE